MLNLGVRIGLTMAVATGLSSIAIAASGISVTADRLDSEIDASINFVAASVAGDARAAQRICQIADEGGDDRGTLASVAPFVRSGAGSTPDRQNGRPARPGRNQRVPREFIVPRELIVQCLDTSGAVISTSASTPIPVSGVERRLASTGGAARTTKVSIDEQDHRLTTIGIAGFGAVQVARSVAERDRVLSSLVWRTGMIAASATAVAIVVGAILARRIVRPLRRLTDASEQIGRSGALDPLHVPNVRRSDEVGRLSRSFGSMIDSLRQSRDAQARLVQDAGHELRTPLTSLRLNVALLSRSDLPDTKRAAALVDLDAELRELTMITDELVALAGDTASTEAPVAIDLGALGAEFAKRWARRTGRVITATTTAVTVKLPPTGARRIIDNLLSNTVKFTPAPTPVELTVERIGENAVLTVRDHGGGIDASELDHVFDRFYRSVAARSVSGSGLRLSIVCEIVTAAGGSASAANHPDGGAVFTITLPSRTAQVSPLTEPSPPTFPVPG